MFPNGLFQGLAIATYNGKCSSFPISFTSYSASFMSSLMSAFLWSTLSPQQNHSPCPAQQLIIIHLTSLPQNFIIHPHWQSHPTPPPLFHLITADSHSSHPSQSAMYLSLPGAINFPRRVNSPRGCRIHFRPLSADATTERRRLRWAVIWLFPRPTF